MLTSIVSLAETEDVMLSRMRAVKRNLIRKALRSGVSIQTGDACHLDRHTVLVTETLERGGIVSLPGGFYRELLNRLGPLGMARVYTAQFEGSIIASSMILGYKDTAYYWELGWDRHYADLSPNDLLNWEIMRSARRLGYRHYDLLRVEPDRLQASLPGRGDSVARRCHVTTPPRPRQDAG